MKNSETNVFINIVKDEDSNTELLKSFLQFKGFRDKFLELTDLPLDLDNIRFEDFNTQTNLNNYGRPDLVLKNDKLELFFELKVINSSLTINQPEGYYEALKESRSEVKGLFFIIPKFYKNQEYYRKKLYEIELKEDKIQTKIIFWDDIVYKLKITQDSENKLLINQYIQYLRKRFLIYPLKYSSKEIDIMFNSETPEGLEKAFQLVYDAYHRIILPKGLNIAFKEKFTEDYNYIFYFKLPNSKIEFFIGIWLYYWKKEGNPICFGVQKHQENENVKNVFDNITRDLGFPEPIEFSEDKNHPYLISYFKKEIFEKEVFLEMVQKISEYSVQNID